MYTFWAGNVCFSLIQSITGSHRLLASSRGSELWGWTGETGQRQGNEFRSFGNAGLEEGQGEENWTGPRGLDFGPDQEDDVHGSCAS